MSTPNLFRKYELKLKSLYKGALSSSTFFTPDAPVEVNLLLYSLEQAAQRFDKTTAIGEWKAGDADAVAEEHTEMLEAVRNLGFALKNRASKAKSGILSKTSEAQKAYDEFIERDLYAMVKTAQYIRTRNLAPKDSTNSVMELGNINISNESSQFVEDVKDALRNYNPRHEAVLETTANWAQKPFTRKAALTAGALAGTGALLATGIIPKSCSYTVERFADVGTRRISNEEDRPYRYAGKWGFHRDIVVDGAKNAGVMELADRLSRSLGKNGMLVHFITQGEYHDPKGRDPNNRIIRNYLLEKRGEGMAIPKLHFEQSESNDFQFSEAEQKFSLTAAVALTPEQAARAKAFLSDDRNKNLPGVKDISVHEGNNPFANPKGDWDRIEFPESGSSNPPLLIIRNTQEFKPSDVTSMVRTTIPILANSVFAGRVQSLESGQVQSR